VLLVGVAALIELPSLRLVVALGISMVFLVIQHEYKPYATAEHNLLAELANAQITATLFFIAMHLTGLSIPRLLGFCCIVLNVVLLPLVMHFNARRLKRRSDILNTFLIETARKRRPPAAQFFDPSQFSEYWKAGRKSEFEVFCATLDWIDSALERPVSNDRWGQILYTLEQLPLMSKTNADVRHGAWRDGLITCGCLRTICPPLLKDTRDAFTEYLRAMRRYHARNAKHLDSPPEEVLSGIWV
jgi:hypothetical protein